jgi:hypothetical protein
MQHVHRIERLAIECQLPIFCDIGDSRPQVVALQLSIKSFRKFKIRRPVSMSIPLTLEICPYCAGDLRPQVVPLWLPAGQRGERQPAAHLGRGPERDPPAPNGPAPGSSEGPGVVPLPGQPPRFGGGDCGPVHQVLEHQHGGVPQQHRHAQPGRGGECDLLYLTRRRFWAVFLSVRLFLAHQVGGGVRVASSISPCFVGGFWADLGYNTSDG